MTCRVLVGAHPSGEMGFWIAKPGFDCFTSDRTSRDQFLFSSSFANRKPLRLLASGQRNTNQPIYLPNSLANLGGTPVLVYRAMTNSTTERQIGYYGVQNDGNGNSYSGTELYNRLVDGNPAYFLVWINGSTSSQAVLIRYMIFLF